MAVVEGPEVFESAVPTPCCDLGHMDFLPKKELAFSWLLPMYRLPSTAANDPNSFPFTGFIFILACVCRCFVNVVQSGSGLAVASTKTWLFV